MSINKFPFTVQHEEGETFLDWTAKELAFRMTFEWDEKEATRMFQSLEEPLSSRVFHYLSKLRSLS
jgi:hypothetical protein